MSLNKVMLIGRLGKDVELRQTANNKSVASFSIATNEVHTDSNGEQKKSVDWHNITVWNKQAENCKEYLKKGDQVYVEGRIHIESFEDKETKEKRQVVKIIAWNVQFLSNSNEKNIVDQEEIPF